jgi:long-chain acyl-CoA synthetase
MTESTPALDYITIDDAVSLYGLFQQRVTKSPDRVAYKSYSAQTQSWYALTWREVAEQVVRWQNALAAESLMPGDRVALNLRNAKEWIFYDQAAMGLGLVLVPLYPDDRPESVAYILQDADVKCLLLQNINQWKRLQPVLTEGHNLRRIIIQNEDAEPLTSPSIYLHEWLANGVQEQHLAEPETDPHQLASIIYTSGTTGKPKGVMLSHHNMLSVAYGSVQYLNIFPEDVFLSFLPLSHTLERTVGYYLPIMTGSTVAFSRGIPQLAEDLTVIKPSVLVAVPRIFERVYNRLTSQLAKKGVIARLLFTLSVSIGWNHFNYRQGRRRYCPSFVLLPLLNKLVANKILHCLGGKLRIAISGGAPLPQHTAETFIGLGLNLLQGYGLTETSPVISVNEPNNNIPSSVGRPIPGVTVKIGANDELLVKGPGNMLGYWNNHKATSQIMASNGWLHTGDQASISQSGHISITGRLKEILVMSNGEKVPPTDIESALLSNDVFEQVVLLGEGQSYLAALIVLNGEHWPALAQQLGLDPLSADALNDKKLHQYAIQESRQLLSGFPSYAKVRRFAFTLAPWTIENGLLTPTMKIKRAQVIAHHQQDVTALYDAD